MSTLLQSWLLGGLSYPALTFVITAGLKSTAVVLLISAVTSFLRHKPALMRLWLWRACSVAMLSVLLWALAPRFVEPWRMSLVLQPSVTMLQTVQQAQQLDLLNKNIPSAPSVTATVAPLLAYTARSEATVPLTKMRVP